MNATTAIDTATVAPPSTHIGPALLCDAARVLHQPGLKSVRGAVVDMPSGAFHPGWSMIDSSVQGNGLDYALAGLRLAHRRYTGGGRRSALPRCAGHAV